MITGHYSTNHACQEATALNHSPIIFIAGMPRSGSMWTYNVCRKLITAAGKTFWPDEVPLDESPVIEHALAHPPEPNQVYCIKTHFRVPVGQPHMRIICNYRDIRDATLSYMRFMKCSFEKGLSVARGSMELTDHYLRQEHSHVLPVRYDGIVSHRTDGEEQVLTDLLESAGLHSQKSRPVSTRGSEPRTGNLLRLRPTACPRCDRRHGRFQSSLAQPGGFGRR